MSKENNGWSKFGGKFKDSKQKIDEFGKKSRDSKQKIGGCWITCLVSEEMARSREIDLTQSIQANCSNNGSENLWQPLPEDTTGESDATNPGAGARGIVQYLAGKN